MRRCGLTLWKQQVLKMAPQSEAAPRPLSRQVLPLWQCQGCVKKNPCRLGGMMGEIVLYAKKSCTQCKKAIAFLNRKGVAYQLKDIVHEPPPRSLLEKVIKAENIYASVNQRSTTYRENHLGKRRTTKNEAI